MRPMLTRCMFVEPEVGYIACCAQTVAESVSKKSLLSGRGSFFFSSGGLRTVVLHVYIEYTEPHDHP